jgi:hypothetical protein
MFSIKYQFDFGLGWAHQNTFFCGNIVPDEIKGRENHHSFPKTLFQVCPDFLYG